ncbi:MAG: hypothetical protein P4L39_11775 [Humidesulfovibrio sp.]|nr:hypothetical protein [Humidesulfovibrio sp.]
MTQLAFKLTEHAQWPADPDAQLVMPPPGGRSFLVACCGLRHSFLFSLDALNGCIHCWVPSAQLWAELNPTDQGMPFLGAGGLPLTQWWPEAENLAGDTVLLWPSDSGILTVRMDPLTLTYRAEVLAPGTCVSPLLPNGDRVYGLMANAGQETLTLVSVSSATASPNECVSGIPKADWSQAVATPHEAILVSSVGQVVANSRRNIFAFLPWAESAGQPVTEFGPPHCDESDGRLWLQTQIGQESKEEFGYGYVLLGHGGGELHKATGARHHTGKSSIKVEQRLLGSPWNDPEKVQFGAHDNDEAVVPLLESVAHGDLLVLRANYVGSASGFLQIEESIPTRFQIHRQQPDSQGFHVAKLHKPWEATTFIFRGQLFLYHPDFKYLPGWTIQGNGQ